MYKKRNVIVVKDEEPIELDKWISDPLMDPVHYFDEDLFDLDEDYISNNIENLKTSSIIEKLKKYDSDDLIELAGYHLIVIEKLKYFYNIVNQVEYFVNGNTWGIDENMDAKECNIDLEFIRKIVRIPLNDIKTYWKEYDENQENIQKRKLEKIENLNLTQLSELCLNILKKVIGGSIEKPNNEYLADLIDKFEINLK